MKASDINDPVFRKAVECIDAGNFALLQELLETNPELIDKRLDVSTEGYFNHPYLLWFVADNPVRIEKLPANILDITSLLIKHARRNGGENYQQQIDYTLGLVATGRIPLECGVQIDMMDLLIDAGAQPGSGHGALAHGNIDAARHLIKRGGKLTLAVAVCFNDIDKALLLVKNATQDDKQAALMGAAMYGNHAMIKMLLEAGADVNVVKRDGFHSHASVLHQAVSSGSLEAVKILIEAGAKLDAQDSVYHGTPLGWAKYMQTEQDSKIAKEKYAEIETFLSKK